MMRPGAAYLTFTVLHLGATLAVAWVAGDYLNALFETVSEELQSIVSGRLR